MDLVKRLLKEKEGKKRNMWYMYHSKALWVSETQK